MGQNQVNRLQIELYVPPGRDIIDIRFFGNSMMCVNIKIQVNALSRCVYEYRLIY